MSCSKSEAIHDVTTLHRPHSKPCNPHRVLSAAAEDCLDRTQRPRIALPAQPPARPPCTPLPWHEPRAAACVAAEHSGRQQTCCASNVASSAAVTQERSPAGQLDANEIRRSVRSDKQHSSSPQNHHLQIVAELSQTSIDHVTASSARVARGGLSAWLPCGRAAYAYPCKTSKSGPRQVERARRRVDEAVDVANVPVLRAQLDAATAATAAEDLWEDQQVIAHGRALAGLLPEYPPAMVLVAIFRP